MQDECEVMAARGSACPIPVGARWLVGIGAGPIRDRIPDFLDEAARAASTRSSSPLPARIGTPLFFWHHAERRRYLVGNQYSVLLIQSKVRAIAHPH